jgi:hypothetical protein
MTVKMVSTGYVGKQVQEAEAQIAALYGEGYAIQHVAGNERTALFVLTDGADPTTCQVRLLSFGLLGADLAKASEQIDAATASGFSPVAVAAGPRIAMLALVSEA